MSSSISAFSQNSVITDQADAESNKRSLILSFVIGIIMFSIGLPLFIASGQENLGMLIPGAILFGVGAFVAIVPAAIGMWFRKRATSNINYYPKPRVIMSLHPLSGKTFVLQNQYPGYDHKFVSFRTEDLALRVIYEQHDAMPIQFVAVEGKPNTYHLLNKYKDGSKADRAYDQWISFANDGKWLYCRYPKKTDAMPVLIEHVEADTIIMNNQWPGQEPFWLSFANEGKWMRVTYQKKEAMPMKLISYSPIEILEAVPGKPVRFRINNRPSSNDAWVGIYPADAGDQDHGNRWGWLRDKHMDNASLPGQSEGRWSIRVFSDGGYTLHDRVDFDIVHSQVTASKYREEFIPISEYDEVWNDAGSRAHQDVSVWRPRLPAGCYLLGMTAKNGHSPPTFPTLVIRASGSVIASPERFDLVWWQERGHRRFWCWRPIPPPGYVSLGDVGTLSEHPPSPRDVVCVALECLSPNKQPLGEQIWNDRGGGAPKDGAFFAQPGSTGLFRCSDDNTHNRPRGEFYTPGGAHVPEETETLNNQRKYVFAPEELGWNEHNGRAKAMGGHLASISSAEENEDVTTISGGKPVWIGGIRKGSGNGPGADHWYWSDGQPWTYTNWHPGEPNNAGGHENRVHLGLQARGTWNDVHEGWSGPAVYKLPAETSSKNIEILEAVPGKPVRFRINNPPSSNDAWVGVYPASAGDHEHGEQGNRWHWIRDIDVNNASLPAQSEGNWSIRVFSDGGFELHHREDFEIERIPFGEQLKIKQEIQEKKEEMSEQIKEKMEEVEQKLPEEIKETESFQEMKSTVENTVESLDEKANQAIEEVIVESSKQIEQVQEKVILSLEDSLSKLNDTLERLDKALMTKDRENIISELSGSQMNLNLTVDRIDNTIGYGIDEALRGGKTIVGNIEGIPHSVSIKVPKSMNDFASGLEKGQTIEQKVTLSTFNSVRKMLEFVIDK